MQTFTALLNAGKGFCKGGESLTTQTAGTALYADNIQTQTLRCPQGD